MSDFEFAAMSESELKELIQSANVLLEQKNNANKEEVIAKMHELAASIKVKLKIKDKTKRAVAKVKYRDGNNTWAGRGVKPKWLQEKLAQGFDISQFAVVG